MELSLEEGLSNLPNKHKDTTYGSDRTLGNRSTWTQICDDHGPQVEEGRITHNHSLGGANQTEV
eukprot:9232350-Prorocentrum_lima.AAC.1